MRKPRHLVLVESPFQLLCAYEYMQRNDAEFELWLRKNDRGANDQQMDVIVAELGLSPSMEFIVRPKHHCDYARAFAKTLTRSRNFEVLVRGSYFSGFQRLLSATIARKETVLLDDGTATLEAEELILDRERNKYSAFSIFKLDERAYVHLTLNEFSSIASAYKCVEHPIYTAFFIGQNLIDYGAIDIESYVAVVERAVSIAGSTLYYVPHRAESGKYTDAISKVANVEILHTDAPIELFLLRKGWYPRRVFSITSTALFTLASIYPRSKAIAVVSRALDSGMIGGYRSIMRQFEAHHSITVLDEIPAVEAGNRG